MRIEIKNIVFAYDRRKTILNGVNFSVESKDRVALVGPSGCGKSTLSQIIAGNLIPQSGEVLIDGKPLTNRGFCPVQLIYQHPENAINPRWKLGKTLTEAWQPSDRFLLEMGIEKEWLNRYPAELSGGEIQRFCITRAIAPETKFIIADEMSTMLDVITQAQIWEILLRIADERGIGLLAVTHNAELANRISSRVINFESLS
ncbi:peptide ABC transporter [Clostridia bacterium]|nr:peptide ABC transporter [Clostridia bacterium]